MRGQKSDIGSTRVAPNGYHYTKTDEFEWRLTHHIVMEEKLGRDLMAHERVYFVDGDRTNLDSDNLLIREVTGGRKKKIAELKAKISRFEAQLADLLEDER
jgi:hypothetical protein|tara:strand:- start:581 stop:883 length:303 start_codon:yes stop_codon:yes gene_type:complete